MVIQPNRELVVSLGLHWGLAQILLLCVCLSHTLETILVRFTGKRQSTGPQLLKLSSHKSQAFRSSLKTP